MKFETFEHVEVRKHIEQQSSLEQEFQSFIGTQQGMDWAKEFENKYLEFETKSEDIQDAETAILDQLGSRPDWKWESIFEEIKKKEIMDPKERLMAIYRHFKQTN